MNVCKNCGHQLHGLYCSHCGQKAKVERITFPYLTHELFHFFTHVEKGFLFTSAAMVFRPGETINNFISGKRKNYQSPVSYFFVWTTIFVLFLLLIEKSFGENTIINYKDYFGPTATTKYAISHLSFVLTIVIPFQAFYLYLLVTHLKWNYFETLVAAIYSLGTIILFQFVFALLALVHYAMMSSSVNLGISDAFKVVYLTWFTFDVLRLFDVRHKLMKGILFLILGFGTFTLWRIYGFPTLVKWMK